MTLGISTNTRLLGLAIIQQGRLLDYRICPHKAPWSPAKVTRILASLEPCARRYSLKTVALSIPHAHHQTSEWKALSSRIERFFKEKAIPVYKKSYASLYSLCAPHQKKTKKALMAALTDRFPELSYCYTKELRNKNKYYIKVFEAVAAALLHEGM